MLLIAYVALLTIMVLLIVIGGLGYVVHRYPALVQPLMVALTGAGVLTRLKRMQYRPRLIQDLIAKTGLDFQL